MTYPDIIDHKIETPEPDNRSMTTKQLGISLREVLQRAAKEHRLVTEMENCIRLLDSNPENVFLCVLPVGRSKNGGATAMWTTLVDAICYQNDIVALRVANPARLSPLLREGVGRPQLKRQTTTEERPPRIDSTCILIKIRKSGKLSPEEIKFDDQIAELSNTSPWMNDLLVAKLPG